MSKLADETVELIRKIYSFAPCGGALHIVLEDGNTDDNSIYWCIENSIPKVINDDERKIFEQCAINLIELGTERARFNCIWEAFNE